MQTTAIVLTAVLRTAAPDSAEAPATVAPGDRITRVAIDAPPALAADLAEAVRLRLPDTRVVVGRASSQGAHEGRGATVNVRRSGAEGHYQIVVTLSGGQAYRLNVRADPGAAPRTLASDLAVLLRGVEEGTVFPAAAVEPAPEEPSPATAPPKRALRPELDVRLDPGLAVGLAPTAPGLASISGGGSLAIGLRTRRALWIGGSVRVLGAARQGHSLLRIRFAAAAGYVVTHEHFELPVLGIVGVEPWFVNDGGGSAPLNVNGSTARPSPLLSGGIAVSPAYAWRLDRRRVSVGGTVELSGAGDVARGMRAPRVRAPSGDTVFRLGGLELFAGAYLSIGFALEPDAPG